MDMTVNDLIKLQQFSGFKVISGAKGLDRKVRAVSVMDAPDIHKWLQGGEFLMTTGYIMKDNPEELTTLIGDIHRVGAAALGIKLGRFITELPVSAVALAEELSFPLVLVPYQYSFVDVINPVLEEIIERQSRQLYFSERIHKSFTSLVIEGGGCKKIVKVLCEVTHRDICYYDIVFKQKICCQKDIIKQYEWEDSEINRITGNTSYPIMLDDKNVGYLVVDGENIDDHIDESLVDIAVEHASTVLKLDMQKRLSNRQLENKYRSELLQDLILDNLSSMDELRARADLYGWRFSPPIFVAIVDIDRFKEKYISEQERDRDLDNLKEIIFKRSTDQLRSHFPQVRYTQFSDSVVYIFCETEANDKNREENIANVFQGIVRRIENETGFTITVGIGERKRNVLNAHISYQEAKKAIRLGRMLFGENRVISYDELGAFRILEHINITQLDAFFHEYLGELAEYDHEHDSNYMETLKALYASDWVAKDASKKLFIHYNTIRARIEKIQEILNIDLLNPETKLNISLALKIAELRCD